MERPPAAPHMAAMPPPCCWLMPPGTGIGIALAKTVAVLRETDAAAKVIVLLTDGENNLDLITPLEAAERAAELETLREQKASAEAAIPDLEAAGVADGAVSAAARARVRAAGPEGAGRSRVHPQPAADAQHAVRGGSQRIAPRAGHARGLVGRRF